MLVHGPSRHATRVPGYHFLRSQQKKKKKKKKTPAALHLDMGMGARVVASRRQGLGACAGAGLEAGQLQRRQRCSAREETQVAGAETQTAMRGSADTRMLPCGWQVLASQGSEARRSDAAISFPKPRLNEAHLKSRLGRRGLAGPLPQTACFQDSGWALAAPLCRQGACSVPADPVAVSQLILAV